MVNRNQVLQKYYFLEIQKVVLFAISITMTTDEPGVIHSGEIWLKSRCEAREEQFAEDISACLQHYNYKKITAVSHSRSIWQQKNQKVVVSLVDDIWACAADRSQDTPYLFDSNTMVITDNHLNCPSVYRLRSTPLSFYGIYSYTPDNLDWAPDRDYTFAINRLDYKRMDMLLQLHRTLGIDTGYVSFNCSIGGKHVPSESTRRQAFLDQAQTHAGTTAEQNAFVNMAHLVPLKNHTLEHDQVYTLGWLNIIIETYSSDNVISFSEKIFRCLVTPAPWVMYAGRYAIAKLRELGFDVMDDIVDHSYDRLIEAQHKMSYFATSSKNTITSLKTQNWAHIKSRAQAAAFHNQTLLEELSRIWKDNQHVWLQQLARDIR